MVGFILLLILAAIVYGASQKGKNPFLAVLKAIGLFFAVPILLVLTLVVLAYRPNAPATSPLTSETPAIFASPVAVLPEDSPTVIPSAPAARVDRLGRVLSDATVLDATGAVIGIVHEGRLVHIIGFDAGRVKIRKHDSQEGFVAADHMVDAGDWVGSVPERTGSP
jgi:hypothetical protein